jgi:HAE1 family hydrophobic/amphiphilic exporter-1
MNIAELFIRRPVATALVMFAILLFGVAGYRLLPVSDLPNVDFPTIQVTAVLPGANPDTMASSVALPLEKQFSTIAGLDSMTSTNTLGVTTVTLQFTLERNLDAAAQDVQSAMTQAAAFLPPGMPTPPSFKKVNPADQPILYLALSSQTLPLSTVDEYAENFMAQRISMVSGVAQVQVYGSQKYAVRIQLDPDAMATRQIGINDVMTAVASGNVNLPTGTLWGAHQAVTVQANGQLYNAKAYEPLVISYRNGSPVRLADLGRVLDSVENDKIAGWFNNTRAVVLAIQKQPGTNTVATVNSINALLPSFSDQMPPSVRLETLYDRSVTIRESVNDVKFTLLLTVGLVVLVIFLFLRNVSATVIPSLALPMSIVGTFAVMYLLDYSIDNLSLMALTLSVGFVVDDAIVMLENIVRHMEQGEGVLEAALNGSKEIGFTILSMTLSLAAVFIPVLFMGGIIGRLLHEFSVTIISAILVSGFVSLTLTPMLCSRYLRPPKEQKHGAVFNFFERVQDGLTHIYDITLRVALRQKFATLMFSFVILGATVWLFGRMPKGFLPSVDNGSIFGFTEAAQGISYEAMVQHQTELNAVVQKNPYVENVMSFVGFGNVNQGIIFLRLKPPSVRPPVDEVMNQLRPQIATVPGIRVFLQNPPPIQIGGQLTKSLYQMTLQSPDTEQLYASAQKFELALHDAPGLQDVTSDLQIKNPQVKVAVDRDKASAMGLTAQQVEDALYTAYGNRQVSTIYAPNNEYRVIMELLPKYQLEPNSLSLLYVRSGTGQLVPLNSIATLTPTLGPLTVTHLGQLPSVTISFNLKPGVSLSQAVDMVRGIAVRTLPSNVTTAFQGTAQAFERSFAGLGILLLMAILVIYIVLGVLYESFIHPITILSGLPSAGFGALVTLMLFHKELNLFGFVGIIMLIGIVKKNAIMMIDFALEAQRNHGKPAAEAIYEGCLVRFRPIMMTTMAALMGTLPIALGFGAGGDSRQPLGLAVVGGLMFSQVVTLYLTPVFYIYMEQLRGFSSRMFGRKAAKPATATAD